MPATAAASDCLAANWLALEVTAAKLQLRQPLHTAAGSFCQREVLLLKVTVISNGQTLSGYGEASALPGWSVDSFADNLVLARQIQTALDHDPVAVSLQQKLPFGAPAWHLAGLDERFPALQQQPVLRFGLELALLDALARYRQLSLAQLLAQLSALLPYQLPGQFTVPPVPSPTPASVAVQCTLGAEDYASCKARLETALQQGFSHAKLKVGVASNSADLQRIEQLLADFPTLTLRLDANAAWDVQQTLSMCQALRDSGVELIEQPVADGDFEDLLQQHEHRAPLLAADESSVPTARTARWMQSGALSALVLKPSVHGGLLPALALLQLAARHDVKVVLSNLLEAAVARSAIAHLAAACSQHPGPHGLATGDWFADDVVTATDQILDGRLLLRCGAGIGLIPDVFSP